MRSNSTKQSMQGDQLYWAHPFS